jgi:adenylate kinase
MSFYGRLQGADAELALVGPPGSGKGTQLALLTQHRACVGLSVGDLLRTEIEQATTVGVAVRRYVERGVLVPDALVLRVLHQRMLELTDPGQLLVLDGYPRTLRQALALDRLLEPGRLGRVIELRLDRTLAADRLRGRRRADDTEATIARRLDSFATSTVPMLEWYRRTGRVLTVDAELPPDAVNAQIIGMLEQRRPAATTPAVAR